MNLDLVDTTHSDFVELPKVLKSGEYVLYALTSIKDILPFSVFWIGFDSLLVRQINLDDWGCMILVTNQASKRFTAIASICDNMLGVEFAIDPACLTQEHRRSILIVTVALHHINGQRKLIGRVYQQRDLVSPDVLLATIGSRFDNPSSILVCGYLMLPVRPCFDISSIHSYRLPKIRKCAVELLSEPVEDLICLPSHESLAHFGKEPREGRLTRNTLWGFNATSPADIGVIFQQPNQVGYRRSAQVVAHHKAVPEHFRIVSARPASYWPSECFHKLTVTLRKLGKYCLDLLNNRRQFTLLTKCSNISIGHLEANPSFWLGVAGVLSTGDSAFDISTSNCIHYTIHRMDCQEDLVLT